MAQPGGNVATSARRLIKDRYEVLGTLGAGGEGHVVKALDRQHDRFVALKIREVRDDRLRDELLNEARILLAVPPHPALPLVREDFFDGDRYVVAMDWVDGTDLATAAARARPTRSGTVERARLPRPGGRGAHPPALPGPARHPRRRQAGEPDPDQGWAREARGLRPVLGARRAAPPRGHAGLSRARARRRRGAVARQRRVFACGHRVRAAERVGPFGRAAVVGGHRARSGRAARGRAAPRPGDRSRAPPGDAGRAGGEPPQRLGRGSAHRRDDVLPLGHRGLHGAVGDRSRGDGRGARAPRRDHRRAGGGSRRSVPQVHGRGRLDGLGVRVGASRRSTLRLLPPMPCKRNSGRVGYVSRSASGCTRARPNAAEPTTSGRPSTWRPGCADRRTAARSSSPRRRPRSWPDTSRPAASWSTSVRTGCADSARRRGSTPLKGPAISAPLPAGESPVSRAAGVRARRPAVLLRT